MEKGKEKEEKRKKKKKERENERFRKQKVRSKRFIQTRTRYNVYISNKLSGGLW